MALARALANNPPVILADEPTGNLDPKNALEIMKLLEEINMRGTTGHCCYTQQRYCRKNAEESRHDEQWRHCQ